MSKIYLIVGASGSGKTRLVNKVEESYGMKSIQSYTTRSPRYPDEKGHIFITEEDYKTFNSSDFVAYTFYDNHHYFATQEQVNTNDLYVIDIEGIRYFKEHYHGSKTPIIVYLYADENSRIKRMAKRGDTILSVSNRILNDMDIFKDYEEYDYMIDTSRMTPDEVVSHFMEIVNE